MDKVSLCPPGKAALVDASDLHSFLGVRTDFKVWIQDQLRQFERNVDYSIHEDKGGYMIILELYCAKQIALQQNSEKGTQAFRHYSKYDTTATLHCLHGGRY